MQLKKCLHELKVNFFTIVFFVVWFCTFSVAAEISNDVVIETQYLKYVIAKDGTNLSFIDKQTNIDHCVSTPMSKFAILTKQDRKYEVSALAYDNGKMTLTFGQAGINAVIDVGIKKKYITFEVLDINDNNSVTKLSLVNLSLNVNDKVEAPFGGCAVVLNLQMFNSEIPSFTRNLQMFCNSQDGFVGAKMAIVGCHENELRNILKQIIRDHKNLPQTDMGGPWACDSEVNRGSYVIDINNPLSEKNVDKWITVAKNLNAKQIDMHTGINLRFGDLEPNPNMYPNGIKGVKKVVDKLHHAGILVGLHTYAFFVAKDSKWVSPVPDPRLGKDKTFTLSKDLDDKDTTVFVDETTQDMSTLTAFHVGNSVTLQIDDELIVYSDINKSFPYAFTKCQRQAWGTKAAHHSKNSKVYHLRERFGLFNPDGDSTLFTEVAQRTADVYNTCGFDMIYLDAIDGAWSLSGKHTPEYYQGKFVFELYPMLKKKPLMEMSAFTQFMWFARSRMGAWDAPSKAYKMFIDRHFLDNLSANKYYMPANLGWWCVFDWTPKDRIRTFTDDVEYLMCKSLATDSSLSWLLGFDPETFSTSYNQKRFASLIKQYEQLRLSKYFPESVKQKLAQPGKEFTLEQSGSRDWQLRPVSYDRHKISDTDKSSNTWSTHNQFSQQPIKLRIEAMLSLASYDGAQNKIVAEFKEPNEFPEQQSSPGVSCSFQTASSPTIASSTSGCYIAKSDQQDQKSAWSMANKKFSSDIDLSQHGFGVWIYGDGNGEVLNFLWKAPDHISMGVSEHYAVINFTGWRYFEFVEPESDRVGEYKWPYHRTAGTPYIETFWVDYTKLNSLSLGYINLPTGKDVKCYLSPIKALPHVKAKLVNPSVTIGDATIIFPTKIESGCYLEFHSINDCKLYGPKGELISDVKPQGDVPIMKSGENQVKFNCSVESGIGARANVTMITQGDTALHK